MQYKKTSSTIYLRADKNEYILQSVKTVCLKEKICGGYFHGIGACASAVLSVWQPDKKEFAQRRLKGTLEMVSLTGNISADGSGNPFLHSHAVFSYLTESGEIKVTAGHLEKAEINYTAEIVITVSGETINRKFNSDTGIEVWDLM